MFGEDRILLPIWLYGSYIENMIFEVLMSAYSVFKIAVVFWHGCCSVWILLFCFSVLLFHSLLHLLTKCQDESRIDEI